MGDICREIKLYITENMLENFAFSVKHLHFLRIEDFLA